MFSGGGGVRTTPGICAAIVDVTVLACGAWGRPRTGLVGGGFGGRGDSTVVPELFVARLDFLGFHSFVFAIGGRRRSQDVFDSLVTPSLFGLVIVVCAQNEKRLRALLFTVALVATALSAVMIHQSQSDFQCVLLRKGEDGAIDFSNGKGDGRRCETSVECEKLPIERGAVYDCERVGLFDSFTTARGRVRWRGVRAIPMRFACCWRFR